MAIKWGDLEQGLYDFYKAQGLCDFGIFGLMGNFYAESKLNPKNLQNSYEEKLGFTDESYTAAVDSGSYKNFVHDGAGYGLHQCTYWSRKQAMLEYHQGKGKSIGDLETQKEFIYKELSESFPAVLKVLKTAASIREASDAVLLNFERPADQSRSVQEKRASYGQEYEKLYKQAQEGGSKDMAYDRNVIVNILLGWRGAKQGDSTHKAIIDLYNTLSPRPRGYKLSYTDAWCAGTWSAAAAKAGYTAIMPVECSCYYLIEAAKRMGIWQENDAYIPAPADAVLYDWDDGANYATTDNQGAPEHVGTVWKVEGSTIYVIEGNMSKAVGVRELKVNGRYIRGFICPKYTTNSSAAPTAGTGGSSGGGLSRETKWTGRTTTTLSVRTWAGKEYDECSFSPLSDGEEISICDEVKAANGDKWYYIKNKAGKYGFVSAAYVVAAGAGTGSAATSYAVGDKVKVTGTFYGNGNGTGGAITKNGATMYVVGLVSSATYKYYIGLAAKPGGVRQGWADPSILEKL
nr:phage tail tip lysozyme [uncultured Schaedlerella sp.]